MSKYIRFLMWLRFFDIMHDIFIKFILKTFFEWLLLFFFFLQDRNFTLV